MNIALISDIHFGVKNNSEEFLNIIVEFFNNLLTNTITKNKVKKLFILGDLFNDRFLIDVLVENVAISCIKKLREHVEDIYIIKGNHDIYHKNTLAVSSLNKFKDMDEHIHVIDSITPIVIENTKLLMVPWLCQGSDEEKEFYRICETETHDVCLGHFEINGFEIVKGTIEQQGLSQTLFNAFTKTFSGHFHIRSKIGNIQYLGCPYEINWNDYNTEKGITLLNIPTLKTKFIQNDISPKHTKIKISDIKNNESVIKDIVNNSNIKLIVDEEIDDVQLDKIISKLETFQVRNIQTIDEREDIKIDNETVQIDETIEDNLSFLYNYFTEIEIPSEINIDILKRKALQLYQDSIKDDD